MQRFRSVSLGFFFFLAHWISGAGADVRDLAGDWVSETAGVFFSIDVGGKAQALAIGETEKDEWRATLARTTAEHCEWEASGVTMRVRLEGRNLVCVRIEKTPARTETWTFRRVNPEGDGELLVQVTKTREAIALRHASQKAADAAAVAERAKVAQPTPAATVAQFEELFPTAPPYVIVSQVEKAPTVRFQSRPQYPLGMRSAGVSGEVVVEFIVTANGDVAYVHAQRASNPAFEKAAIDCVSQWKYRPGMVGGRAVNTRMTAPIVFSLPGT